MSSYQRLAVIVILCVAFAVGAFLYPQCGGFVKPGTTGSSEITFSSPASCAQLLLDKSEFNDGEEIKFVLKNECSYPIALRNSAPWKIKDELGRGIYSPIALQVIVEVDLESSKTWVWDQRDDRGSRVKPGTYFIVLETMNAGVLTKAFRIRSEEL
ncbi:MAG: hypothetical protein J7L79_05720 [Thaumarchaeota archaeon]|nr:hypothetical protein [Nitrososphaerota archaeon]